MDLAVFESKLHHGSLTSRSIARCRCRSAVEFVPPTLNTFARHSATSASLSREVCFVMTFC
jgi:hypothetical protein